jgi:hypothetical protein
VIAGFSVGVLAGLALMWIATCAFLADRGDVER